MTIEPAAYGAIVYLSWDELRLLHQILIDYPYTEYDSATDHDLFFPLDDFLAKEVNK